MSILRAMQTRSLLTTGIRQVTKHAPFRSLVRTRFQSLRFEFRCRQRRQPFRHVANSRYQPRHRYELKTHDAPAAVLISALKARPIPIASLPSSIAGSLRLGDATEPDQMIASDDNGADFTALHSTRSLPLQTRRACRNYRVADARGHPLKLTRSFASFIQREGLIFRKTTRANDPCARDVWPRSKTRGTAAPRKKRTNIFRNEAGISNAFSMPAFLPERMLFP